MPAVGSRTSGRGFHRWCCKCVTTAPVCLYLSPPQVTDMAIIAETINGVVIDDDLMALFGEDGAEAAPGPSPPVELGASGWA